MEIHRFVAIVCDRCQSNWVDGRRFVVIPTEGARVCERKRERHTMTSTTTVRLSSKRRSFCGFLLARYVNQFRIFEQQAYNVTSNARRADEPFSFCSFLFRLVFFTVLCTCDFCAHITTASRRSSTFAKAIIVSRFEANKNRQICHVQMALASCDLFHCLLCGLSKRSKWFVRLSFANLKQHFVSRQRCLRPKMANKNNSHRFHFNLIAHTFWLPFSLTMSE